MKLGGTKLNLAIRRLRETGKIDSSVGGKNVGLIIDHHNQTVEERKDKTFNKEITARNKYFWKLWKRAIEDMKSGVRPKQNVFTIKPRFFMKGMEEVNN